jgi:hypothetical protein
MIFILFVQPLLFHWDINAIVCFSICVYFRLNLCDSFSPTIKKLFDVSLHDICNTMSYLCTHRYGYMFLNLKENENVHALKNSKIKIALLCCLQDTLFSCCLVLFACWFFQWKEFLLVFIFQFASLFLADTIVHCLCCSIFQFSGHCMVCCNNSELHFLFLPVFV